MFTTRHLASLQEHAARILETRAIDRLDTLARALLDGFAAVCARAGLDALPAELSLDDDETDTRLRKDLAAKLAHKESFDPRGPRNAKPKQLADCVIAVLGITVVEAPDRTITLGGDVRREVAAALEPGLAPPGVRDEIIARARAGCEERYLASFDKIAAHLDERGWKLERQAKVPIDAMHATQRLLADARHAVIEQAAGAALDRAIPILARASADAAARLDQPITLAVTPRDVALRRARDATTLSAIGPALLDAVTELADLAWQAYEAPARAYAASATFAVGELIEHPKFGRGTVVAVAAARIDVEFADGKRSLVHGRT